MNKKLIFYASLFILSLVSVVYIIQISKRSPSQKRTQTAGQKAPLASPEIPSYTKKPLNIEVLFPEDGFNFPKSAPLLKAGPGKHLSEIEAQNYANKLGFDNNFFTFNDAEFGKTNIWKGPASTLIVYLGASHLVLTLEREQNPINKQLSNEAITAIAKKFLIDNSLEGETSLSYPTIIGLDLRSSEPSVVSIEKADAYKVNFSSLKEAYKIIEINPLDAPISVWLDLEGKIFKVEVKKLGEISPTQEKYSLKSYKEMINAAVNAKIVSINDGNILPGDFPETSIGKVTIQNIDLAYFRENTRAELYQPIYVLSGTVNISGYENALNITLYLPALKQ